MEVDLGPEIAQFRAELRDWIASNAPADLPGLADWNMATSGGGQRGKSLDQAATHPSYQKWEASLSAERLICPNWSNEYGGRGLGALELAVLNEEFYRAKVPRIMRGPGEILVGPAVIVHGTSDQKQALLPPIVTGEHRYCQGFSEPNHGSDLASLETRGVTDGDELVITGQKVWTSRAAEATHMFLLCRTDASVEKHAGISYVVIDFRAPGVDFHPIKQMSGATEFCSVFLDEVRTPLASVIGGLNNGWRVAMTTLGHERGDMVRYLGFEQEFWNLVDAVNERGRNDNALVRQRLAWAYTQVSIMRYSGLRNLAKLVAGQERGPEASITKLFWSEYHRRLGEMAVDMLGPSSLVRPPGADYAVDFWQDVFLASRAGTIYAGSSEIQRNIIGERVLGLSREPNRQ